MSPVYLIFLGTVGIFTLVMAYFAHMAVFRPQKVKDIMRRYYGDMPDVYRDKDMHLRTTESPKYIWLLRVVTVAGLLGGIAMFIRFLNLPSAP